jgi:Fur family transcriptional regulator, ferric uptake regulator
MSSKGRQASVDFQSQLQKRNLKYTHVREVILNEVMGLKVHFDADGLFEILKGKGHRIARDTVYRTIPVLLECGVIQKSVGAGKGEYFERVDNRGHHDHMVCIRCGKVIEFRSDEIESYQSKVCADYGFELSFHDHKLFGYCAGCRN